MFERFPLRKFSELYQKRKVVDSPVTDAQRTFARRAFQLRILSGPMKIAGSGAGQMVFPFSRQPGADWDLIEVRLQIDALVLANAGFGLGANAFGAARI